MSTKKLFDIIDRLFVTAIILSIISVFLFQETITTSYGSVYHTPRMSLFVLFISTALMGVVYLVWRNLLVEYVDNKRNYPN